MIRCICIAENEKELKQLQAQSHVRPMSDGAIGTPEQVAEKLLGAIEQGVDRFNRSTGNFQAGEPEFRVRPFVDNYTPWQCR